MRVTSNPITRTAAGLARVTTMTALTTVTVVAAMATLPSAPIHAQAVAEVPPTADAAVDADRYESVLDGAYAADEPGAAALVARGGEIEYLGAVGMADLELGVSLAPDMVFEVGSITKQFTAAAIMLLEEEGALSVSDPITRHLPDYPSYGDEITIEHLLAHTSGIVSYTGIPGYMLTEVKRDVTVQELIDVFDDLPREFEPGERWAYNNSGYILLGAIVEAASGMSYAEFVRTRFFEPLGMEDAYYGCSRCLIPGRVSGYGTGPEDGYANQRYLSFSQPYAAGSLMMTVEDHDRWSRALFGGSVVSARSLERMTAPYVLNDGDTTEYGYGFLLTEVRGRHAIRHGGGIFGFVSDAMYLPDDDVFVAVFSNNAAGVVEPEMVAEKLAALAVGDPYPEFEAITLPEDVLRRYVGVYEIEDADGAQRVVTVRDGALHTQRDGGAELRAIPMSETDFFYPTSHSHFEFVVEDGRATGMVMYQAGGPEGEPAVRVSDEIPTVERITLPASVLERYVGVYELEPGFEITISLDGDQLIGQATGQGPLPMHPTSETEFVVEGVEARVTFELGDDGRASALTLHQGGQVITGPRTS